MARYVEATPEQEGAWAEWVASRPPNVRKIAERFNPWTLYQFKDGQRCVLVSFSEAPDGRVTLTVNVTGEFNMVAFDRSVFGVDPDSLEESDLPAASEVLGTMLTEREVIDAFVDIVRPSILAARGAQQDGPDKDEGAKE